MKSKYEKPEIKMETYSLNSAVADTCWGLSEDHPNQKTRYYDVTGEGIVSFNVVGTDTKCNAPDAYSIQYITRNPETNELQYSNGDKYEQELEKALAAKGGNNGQPYKGIDADFPAKIVPDSK